MDRQPRRVSPEERQALARTLGDTPESVISVHLLARGLAEAYVSGDPTRPDGVIVQGGSDPGELMSFGSDAEVLWELLRLVEGWWCVSVVEPCAEDLGRIIEERTGSGARYYGDIYHLLRDPVASIHHETVRLLTPDDLEFRPLSEGRPRGHRLHPCAVSQTRGCGCQHLEGVAWPWFRRRGGLPRRAASARDRSETRVE
jgi:hypothetical protein